MDPISALGVAAGATQFAGQLITVGVSIAQFYSKVKEAPETIRQQLLNIQQLSRIAQLVIQNAALQATSVESALRSCLQHTSTIERELRQVSVDVGDGTAVKFQKAFLAALKEKKFGRLFEELEKLKSTLMLCIQEVDSRILHTIGLYVTRVEDSLSRVSVRIDDTNLKIQTIVNELPVLSQAAIDTQSNLLKLRNNVSAIDDQVSMVDGKISTIYCDFPAVKSQVAAIHHMMQNLSLEKSLPPRKTYYKVPNRRTSTFVGRQDVLDIIDQVLLSTTSSGPRIAVIRGMGGQGKTQIALHYCFAKQGNPYTSIFWIDATSEASAQNNFEIIFDTIKSPSTMLASIEAKVEYVLEYFAQTSEPWLLVFDNCDRLDYRVQDLFPQGETGAILLTSRNAATRDLVADDVGYIELQGLPEDAALELLYRLTKIENTPSMNDNASRIVGKLGHHPLAITQGASYIKKQKLNFESFLDHYESRRRIILETTPALTEYRRRLRPADKETALNVFTTWELSFQQLQERTSEGGVEVKLMTLLAFFDHQNVSEMLLRDCKGRFASAYLDHYETFSSVSEDSVKWLDEFKTNGKWDTNLFCDVVIGLSEISLVQSWERRGTDDLVHLTIHPLVKDWIRLRAPPSACQMNVFIAWLLLGTALYENFDSGNYRLPPATQQGLVRHVQVLINNQQELLLQDSPFVVGPTGIDLHKAQYECGYFMYKMGHYASSEKILQTAMDFFGVHLGPTDWWTRESMKFLIGALRELGKYEAAKDLAEAELNAITELKGPDSPSSLRSALNVARILIKQGQLEASENLLKDLVVRSETKLGSHHSVTLEIYSALAIVRSNYQDFREAEVLCRKAWSGYAKLQGPYSKNTLICITSLAITLQSQERYDEAFQLYDQALDRFETTLGPDHPDSVWCKKNRNWTMVQMSANAENSRSDNNGAQPVDGVEGVPQRSEEEVPGETKKPSQG